MGSCCQRRAAAGLPEQAGSASGLVGTPQPSVKPSRPSTTSLTEAELEEAIEEPSSSEGAKLHAQNELRRRAELRRGDANWFTHDTRWFDRRCPSFLYED